MIEMFFKNTIMRIDNILNDHKILEERDYQINIFKFLL